MSTTFGNWLLDRLSPEGRAALDRRLRTVVLDKGQVLHDLEKSADAAFFPTKGALSILATMADGRSIEIGIVGKEGMFGVGVLLGDDAAPEKVIVQLVGEAIRVSSRDLRRAVRADAKFQSLLLRYAEARLIWIAQTAACNRLHLLQQRCARWLLSLHDHADGDRFAMTHDLLSAMLGARRASVTHAIHELRNAGLVEYRRGILAIIDREGLEHRSCECYRFIRYEFERLMGPGALPSRRSP